MSPDMETKPQVDCMLADRANKNIRDCGVMESFKCDTDH